MEEITVAGVPLSRARDEARLLPAARLIHAISSAIKAWNPCTQALMLCYTEIAPTARVMVSLKLSSPALSAFADPEGRAGGCQHRDGSQGYHSIR